jgi:segregation and condensation protein B
MAKDKDEPKLPMASSLQQVVGALIFGSDRPVSIDEIRKCLAGAAEMDKEGDETVKLFAEASPREIKDVIKGITKELSRLGLGVVLEEVNGSFRFQTEACCGRWLRILLKTDRPNRLSRPALETLAIIAYRQPIAKSEIMAIRGVNVDHLIKNLMELHLIRIVGRSELPGRPFLYGTTPTFLEHFGLRNLKELNEIDPTLQRSKRSERVSAHKKEKKEEKAETNEADPSLFDEKPENPEPETGESKQEHEEAGAESDAVEEILMDDVEAPEEEEKKEE